MVPGHSALLRADLSVDRGACGHLHCLDRHPVHWALPTGHVRLRGRRRAMGAKGDRVLLAAGHRQVSTFHTCSMSPREDSSCWAAEEAAKTKYSRGRIDVPQFLLD